MKLFNRSGDPEHHENLDEFGPPPDEALALKFTDYLEEGRWVTDPDDLQTLIAERAPLTYTALGLQQIAEGAV
jgi:hypothetical protein